MDENNGGNNGRALHQRAQAGAMLHSFDAAYSRAIIKVFDEWFTLLRRTVKVSFDKVDGEFVPVARIAKRGAINGTTYIFMRRLGEPSTLYVYDWSQCGGVVPLSMNRTNDAERAECKLLSEVEYPSEAYEAAGFRAPPLAPEDRGADGKPLDEKTLRRNRAERMSARLEALLSVAVPIPTLAEG